MSSQASLIFIVFRGFCCYHSSKKSLFFVCIYRMNLPNLKESSDRLMIVAKRFLKLPHFHMLLKQKSPSLSRNLALRTFGKLLIVFSTKVYLLYILYSMARWCCFMHLIEQNYLLKIILRTVILMTQLSFYLFSLLKLI